MPSVIQVRLSRGAYHVCNQHVHTTDGEEVMGLLVGEYLPADCEQDSDADEEDDTKAESENYICDVIHAVILGRSDKRKDRVEIPPEMLIDAQQIAEEISVEIARKVNIVGWYHSHPKITVFPSTVDLKTQWGYQQMDDRFVGLIFSVFNKPSNRGIHDEVIGGFQAVRVGNGHGRTNVPVIIKPTNTFTRHNQQALLSLSKILEQEQLSVLEQSKQLYALDSPLQHSYNNGVAIQRVSEICEAISVPMNAVLYTRLQQMRLSIKDMDAYIHYLTKLLKDKEQQNEGEGINKEEDNEKESNGDDLDVKVLPDNSVDVVT